MTHVYIDCCSEDGGIQHYMFENGKLTLADTLHIDRPMYSVIDGDRMHIILRDLGDGNGGALSCKISEDGGLKDPTEPVTTHGVVPCHHCIKEGKTYVVNYVSGSIVKLPDTVVTHKGHGVHPTRQEKAHTHFVTVAPDGDILCTDLGLDRIYVYDSDLNEKSFIQMHHGCGPRHLVFSKDGKTLYCANELEPSVSVIDYEKAEVKNTYKLPYGTAAAIRLVGDDLYVSVRASDCIVRFKTAGDALVEQEITDCMGKSPRDFDIVDGYIICTNEASDDVTVFKLVGGKPVYTDKIKTLGVPLCVNKKCTC